MIYEVPNIKIVDMSKKDRPEINVDTVVSPFHYLAYAKNEPRDENMMSENQERSCLRMILKHVNDVDSTPHGGCTALMWCAMKNDLAGARALIEAGANVGIWTV